MYFRKSNNKKLYDVLRNMQNQKIKMITIKYFNKSIVLYYFENDNKFVFEYNRSKHYKKSHIKNNLIFRGSLNEVYREIVDKLCPKIKPLIVSEGIMKVNCIRKLRIWRGLLIRELAEKVDIDYQLLGRIEKNERTIEKSLISKIAKVLDVSKSMLFEKSEDNNE